MHTSFICKKEKSQRCVGGSRLAVFYKYTALENFALFTGKSLYWSPLLTTQQNFRPSALQLFEKETPAKVFSCNFCKIFKNPALYRKTVPYCLFHVKVAEFQPATTTILLVYNNLQSKPLSQVLFNY